MEQVVINVEGMTCMHCKMAVEKALKGVPGVQEADVDLSGKKVKVTYNAEKAKRADLDRAITDAGYNVVS